MAQDPQQELAQQLIKKNGASKAFLKVLLTRFLKIDTLPPQIKDIILTLPGMQEFDIQLDISQGIAAFTSTVSISGNPLRLELFFAQGPTQKITQQNLPPKETIRINEKAQTNAQAISAGEKLAKLFEQKGLKLRVVIALPEGFLLSNISAELKPLDTLHIGQSYFIITKDPYTDPEFGKIKAGVNFVGEFKLGALEGTLEGLNTFLSKIPHMSLEAGKGSIRISGLLTPTFIGSKLSAALPGQLSFGTKNKALLFTTTPLTLEFEITGVKTSALSASVQAGMKLDLKGQAEPLLFKTIFTLKSNTSLGIAGAMDGLAQIVPNVPIKVGNIWLGGSINLLTWASTGGIFPFEGIDIGGSVDIFDQRIDIKSCVELSETDATVVFLGEYEGTLNTESLVGKYREYTEMMRNFYHQHTGAFGKAANLSRDIENQVVKLIPNMSFTQLRLFISLTPTKCMADYYPAGLGLTGAASFGPIDGQINLSFGTDAIEGEGTIRPIKLGRLTISGQQPTDDVRMKLAINFDKAVSEPAQLAELILDGTIRLDVPPGFMAGQTIEIDATHLNLEAHGSLGSLQAGMAGSISLLDPFAQKVMVSLDSGGIEQFNRDLQVLAKNVLTQATSHISESSSKTQEKIKEIQEKIKRLQEDYLYPNQEAILNAQRCSSYTAKIVPGGTHIKNVLAQVVDSFAKTVHVPDILTTTAQKFNIVIPGKIEDIHQAMLKALQSVLQPPKESVSFTQAAKACALTAKNITQLPSKMMANAMAITLIQVLEKQRTDLELVGKGAEITLSIGNQLLSVSRDIFDRLAAESTHWLDITKIYAAFALDDLPKFVIEGKALDKPISINVSSLSDYGKILALIIHAIH